MRGKRSKSYLEKVRLKLENIRWIAILIIIAGFIIALGNISDSIGKMGSVLCNLIHSKNEDEANFELIGHLLRPIYFDLRMEKRNSDKWKDGELDPYGRTSILDSSGIEKLKKYSEILRQIKTDYVLLIEGHTSKMTVYSNEYLAKSRTDNVKKYLEEEGVPDSRMRTVLYGGENWSGSDDQYSERVEFKIFGKGESKLQTENK